MFNLRLHYFYNMLKIVATRATRMPVSPAAWSSSSRMSLGGGGAGGGGEVVLAVDGGEVMLAVDGGEVMLAVDGGGGGGVGESVHVAAVRVPAVQELVPETVCPELHVGWHVDPLARELVQLPTAPFVGAVDASQD